MNDTFTPAFAYDPEQIMTLSVDGEMDTVFQPVPEAEYQAGISEVKPVTGVIEKGENAGKHWAALDLVYDLDQNPELEEVLGRKPKVRQRMFLDINEQGQLDVATGRNLNLGRLRDAAGQNGPGAWSPGMLIGARVTVAVTNFKDERSGDLRDQVKRVTSPTGV